MTHHADDCGVSCGLTECDCGAEPPRLLCRCGKVHTCQPFDMQKAIADGARALSDEIDAEVMRSLKP